MVSYYDRRRRGNRQTTWPEFWGLRKMILGQGEEEVDPLERAQKVASYGSTLLDIQKKQRDLAGPSPGQKYQEEERSKQVKSALAMYAELYKTAGPASKKRLTEQLTSLWGMMNKAERTESEMIASHTPINPDVQKAMWFEETNPRPRMPIVREGDGTWTNVPPRSPEYRKAWAEFDIASDEWNTLREMAISGKSAKEAGLGGIPRQYQTDDSNITAERNPLTKGIEFTDWREVKANHAEIQVAIDKKWATWGDIKRNKSVPLSDPREYVENGRPVTVTQNRDLRNGGIKLEYRPAGPQEGRVEAPKALTDAIALVDGGLDPGKLKVKSPDVRGYYAQLSSIIKAKGDERAALQLDLQNSIAAKYPSEERYIPFVPLSVDTGFLYWAQGMLNKVPLLNWVVSTPTVGGKGGNVLLVKVDRRVPFLDRNRTEKLFWWSESAQVALDYDGVPIQKTLGKPPGSQIDENWSE